MTARRLAVLLVGSPRPTSTSASLGAHLLDRLALADWETRGLRIAPTLAKTKGVITLISRVDTADLVILASPLYVDSLPAPVMRALEVLGDQRRGGERPTPARLAAVLNCGFPEARQNETAVAVCRRFAEEARFEWAGALAMGMGGLIDGRPLKGVARADGVRRALTLAGDALAAGRPIPPEAERLMARRPVPRWLYLWKGARAFKRQAKQAGVLRRLRDRPYEP